MTPRRTPRKKTASRPTAVKGRALHLEKFMPELAKHAGASLLQYFGKVKRIETKLHAGIVTEADKITEKRILDKIFRKFPDSSIITEETGEYQPGRSLCWVVDPLDGTSNFAHGFPWFCVSIGLYEEGRPRAGVIYQPLTKEMFFAERGKGAWLNGKRIRVSSTARVEQSLLGTGFYYSKGERLREEMEIFRRLNEQALGVRRPGSAALDLACVACGRYDGFWERGLSSWDVAAGFVLVSEAGGSLSNYRGESTTMHESECVASNARIHQEMVQLIKGS